MVEIDYSDRSYSIQAVGPQFEILPGLFARLSYDADVCFETIDGDRDGNPQISNMRVAASESSLGFGLGVDVLSASNLVLKGQIEKIKSGRNKWDIIVRNLEISMGSLALNTSEDEKQVSNFLEYFGGSFCANNQASKENAQKEETGEGHDINEQEISFSPPVDFMVPNAVVHAMACKLSHGNVINFPECKGIANCTFRTLFQYYCQSLLNAREEISRSNAGDAGVLTAVSDVTSVVGRMSGMAIGTALLGPVGSVAGYYIGGKVGRKHTAATAGLVLFGPVGLVAGAAMGDSTRGDEIAKEKKSKPPASFDLLSEEPSVARESEARKGITKKVREHLDSNKYEYAGTTGVCAGALAGAPLGPIGMVTGAVVGSIAARNVTESVSDKYTSTTVGKKSYKFGDGVRALTDRGKKLRGSNPDESYRFGDLSRGLLGWGNRKL